MPSWHLTDASGLAEKYRYTFFKSGAAEIAQVKPGENVKLIFAFKSDDPGAPDAERMWVIVDSIGKGGHFTGRLDNDPRWINDLKAGDTVQFKDIHIINTEHDNDNNLVNKYLRRCFVTSRVLNEGVPVGYLYREDPDNEKDSGWRILAGDESDAYMDEAENIHFVSLGAVLSCDDSIIGLLDRPSGSSFTRETETNEFVSEAAEG